LAASLAGCAGESEGRWPGKLLGADFDRGHALRDLDPARAMAETGPEEHVGVLIAGGGVAGLATGWRLAEAGFNSFTLLELEDDIGGNARGGANKVSAFPWGAHYLPIPNREAKALIHAEAIRHDHR
jgi:NADPH-dependent 2,4-dienoyl-CoA reductase/sulfur reductase-like enzyme